MGKSFAVLQKLCGGGQGSDYPLLNMLVGYSSDTVSTNAIQKTAPLPALNALPPQILWKHVPPQFFTGRSRRPAGIGIEAPE